MTSPAALDLALVVAHLFMVAGFLVFGGSLLTAGFASPRRRRRLARIATAGIALMFSGVAVYLATRLLAAIWTGALT